MTYCIGLVYIKNDTELLEPIELGAICDETRYNNDVTNLPCVVYAKNETELL